MKVIKLDRKTCWKDDLFIFYVSSEAFLKLVNQGVTLMLVEQGFSNHQF